MIWFGESAAAVLGALGSMSSLPASDGGRRGERLRQLCEKGQIVRSPPDFSRRIPQLDGLRGVAIALVIVYHYVTFSVRYGDHAVANVLVRLVSFGWSGVDLFFVLSGFLIGGILLDARGARNYFRVFYLRRVCRIFPLYFALLGTSFAAMQFSQLRPLFELRIPWLAYVTFCQNFWMAFTTVALTGALNPTWSLAVEEQFYLAIPVLIYVARPKRLVWLLGGGIVLAPLIRLTIRLINPDLTMADFVLLPCRMDALLLGVAAAYFVRAAGAWEILCQRRTQLWTAMEVLTVACALIVLPALTPGTSPSLLLQVVGYDCLDLLYVCLLLACLVDERLARALKTRWLMELGSIAYGVYLLNVPVFRAVEKFIAGPPGLRVPKALLALALTIALAKASWEWFEKPLVRLGHKAQYRGECELTRTLASVRSAR